MTLFETEVEEQMPVVGVHKATLPHVSPWAIACLTGLDSFILIVPEATANAQATYIFKII